MAGMRDVVIIFLSVAIFASCSSDNSENANNSRTPDNSETDGTNISTIDTEPTTQDYLETLAVEDFGGYTFTIIGQSTVTRPNFHVEEEIGEPMNDSLYRRDKQIEERFNIQIKNMGFEDREQVRSLIETSVRAQDLEYDMILTSMAGGLNTLAPSGMLYDLKSLNYLRLEESWWVKSMSENMQVNGRLFYTSGDISPCYYLSPVVCVYNKKTAQDFGMENLNQLVLNNEWTSDKFAELMKDKNIDLDGDGEITKSDSFGYVQDNCGILLFTGFGGQMTLKDNETVFRLNLDMESKTP